mmetsp:Transcript_32059/g.68298  ORF Transcript_32059/g.68298 Transcript_32059/m.68298 type:complete len:157 (-) Transcript_32059:112-582(-)
MGSASCSSACGCENGGTDSKAMTIPAETTTPFDKEDVMPEDLAPRVVSRNMDPPEIRSPDDKGLTIVFKLPDGTSLTRRFTYMPLGLDFVQQIPMEVYRIKEGDQADTLGVKKGWQLQSANGKELGNMEFIDAFELLKTLCGNLPKGRDIKNADSH